MKNKQIVFFDYDGVIVNTFKTTYRIARDIDHSIKKEEYRKWFEKNPHESISKKEGKNSDKFIKEFFKKFNKKLKQKGVNKKIASEVKTLSQNYTLMIISSTGSRIIKEQLESEGLGKYFHEILGYDVHTSKSKKISDILKVYKTDKKESIFVTDTLGDIREADAVGVKSIGVTWGYHDKETLLKGNPVKILNNPSNISSSVESILN